MELVIEHVSKRYKGSFWGLKDFDAVLKPGVIGLLGPNGAGKSTLMRILATITKATEGRVLWNGTDIAREPDKIREVLGYLPQDFSVYPHLNAVEFLSYLAALKGLDGKTARKRIEELLHVVNLTEARSRALGGFSGGMRQRVGIAQALLNDPQVLIVDEPTVGLDPEERVRFRNLLSDLSGERIVILSTHIVSDVEATASDIIMINQGRMIVNCTPEELLQVVQSKVWEVTVSSADLADIRQRYLVSTTIRRATGMQLRLVSDQVPAIAGVKPAQPTLEDAYLYHVSNHAAKPEQTATPLLLDTVAKGGRR